VDAHLRACALAPRLAGWGLDALEDMARLPFTEACDLERNDPPLLALSLSAIARAVTLDTSGTGGPPKRHYFTAEDLEATIDFFHHGPTMLTRPGDRLGMAFPAGWPGGIGEGLTAALHRLGALPLLDDALFAIEGVADFTASVQRSAPATPRLSIAAPEAVRSPALLDAVHARLAVGETLRNGALRAEAGLADAIVFRHRTKRRLHIEENTPCVPYC